MFEQSLYDIDPVAPPTAEGDLFHGYEIRNWDFGPRIYKVLAIAGAANLLAIIITAQTSLLTTKGCDSPLVSSVCQALDTIVVGAELFGTKRDYIDAAYEKTDLGDVDVTFVDVSGQAPPLSYPEGYFQLANPEQFVAQVEQTADPFSMGNNFPTGVPITPPSSTGGNLINTRPVAPKKNDDLIDGDLPGAIGETKPGKPGKPKATPSPKPEDTSAGTKVDPTAPVADVEINKRPFVDLANNINELLEKNQVKLESPFLVNATGKLDKTGKLDPKTFKFLKAESPDPKMIEVVKQAIQAMNDSQMLQYLSLMSGKDLSFQVQQDEYNVTAFVSSEFDNDLRPKTLSTLFNAFISDKKKAKESPEADANDKDDLVLLQNATATPTGKKLVISFAIPKADLQRMIQRKLAEQKAAPKPNTVNNNVSGRGNENTALRN